MVNSDLNIKIQNFFNSDIETLELSKLYIFDSEDIKKIEINVNLVKHIKNNHFYFTETPFYAVGSGLTSYGFRHFDTKNVALFTEFHKILNLLFEYHNKKNVITTDMLFSALQNWNNIKPKNYIQNIFRTVVPKSFFEQKARSQLQHTY